jgi:hypothetical protein
MLRALRRTRNATRGLLTLFLFVAVAGTAIQVMRMRALAVAEAMVTSLDGEFRDSHAALMYLPFPPKHPGGPEERRLVWVVGFNGACFGPSIFVSPTGEVVGTNPWDLAESVRERTEKIHEERRASGKELPPTRA